MSNIQISIIIPMFKVADYVSRCIESLENQDIDKSTFEIICINDGSPDNCQEIVENLQKKYSNIILLNQENQGVSMARNNGIAVATGKYILPIDPDDYVVPNTFGQVLSLANQNNLEVLYLGFEIFDKDEVSIWKTNYSHHNNSIYSGVEGYFAARGKAVKDPDRSWAVLFKKEVLEKFNINYPKNVPYLEDGLFLGKVFSVVSKVAFDDTIFYQRTTRKGSATNSRLFYSENAIRGFILAVQDIKLFGRSNKLNEGQNQLINHVSAKFVIHALSPAIYSFNLSKYFKIIAMLKKENLDTLNTNGLSFLYKKHIEMYNFSKLIFPFYFRITNK
jgi:glycosyltransferase involved in cell wall biosynthesis